MMIKERIKKKKKIKIKFNNLNNLKLTKFCLKDYYKQIKMFISYF